MSDDFSDTDTDELVQKLQAVISGTQSQQTTETEATRLPTRRVQQIATSVSSKHVLNLDMASLATPIAEGEPIEVSDPAPLYTDSTSLDWHEQPGIPLPRPGETIYATTYTPTQQIKASPARKPRISKFPWVPVIAAVTGIVIVGSLVYASLRDRSEHTTNEQPGIHTTSPISHTSTPPATTVESSYPPYAGEFTNPSFVPDDPNFSWWGDGITDVALSSGAIIGSKGHDYYLHLPSSEGWVADALKEMEEDNNLGGVVVFAYGTTEEITADHIEKLRDIVGTQRVIIVVGPGVEQGAVEWSERTNAVYQHAADTFDNIVYVNWQLHVSRDPSLIYNGFIPTEAGAQQWTRIINRTISRIYL